MQGRDIPGALYLHGTSLESQRYGALHKNKELARDEGGSAARKAVRSLQLAEDLRQRPFKLRGRFY